MSSELVVPVPGSITLILGGLGSSERMEELAASLAQDGNVHVLDGGNTFSAYRVARLVNRHRDGAADALQRVFLARAFTCYQVITLLRQTQATGDPKLVMGLLATFGDESVSLEESQRLVRLAVGELRRLSQRASVIVSTRRPRQPERRQLIEILAGASDRILHDEGVGRPVQAGLF